MPTPTKKPNVICVIMGGGRGTRLYPLTRERCKPAVPLGGKYRLVDIPISNCLNSGYNRIFVLTQFNTASLHRHIQEAYKFDPFGGGYVDILSAEQTEGSDTWYQGTADAVRQNLHHYDAHPDDIIVILSGDQLYRMDISAMVNQHIETEADVTIAARALLKSEVEGLGLMRVDDQLKIQEFAEKPKDPAIIDKLVVSDAVKARMQDQVEGDVVLASMGIYVFTHRMLRESLDNDMKDFGKEIIPGMLGRAGLFSYIFDDYWEDIGTVRSFFECNLRLTDDLPPFDFYDPEHTVYTRARFLASSKINGCHLRNVLIAGGGIIEDSSLKRCVVGVRAMIGKGCDLDNVIVMGSDWFETAAQKENNTYIGRPHMGIGKNCTIRHAIIDKNARIGDNVKLDPAGKDDGNYLGGDIVIRDGVLIATKGSTVPSGTVL